VARIVYGVQGEGRGHSSRSRVVIEHLLAAGHAVRVFTSHKAYAYLHPLFPDVHDILGLAFVFDGERVDVLKTVQRNLQDATSEGGRTIRLLSDAFKEFRPDVAITDFEPFVPMARALSDIPLLSVDHQHILSQYRLEYPYAWRGDYLQARAVVDSLARRADHYFVTSFFFPPPRPRYARRATLVGPVLRREVLLRAARAQMQGASQVAGAPILLYATTAEARLALLLMEGRKETCVAYGFADESGRRGNIDFRPPSTEGFLEDLAEAHAVVTNGGYTLMSEALALGKPVYAIPIRNQFEQMMNGHYLERLGYGLYDLEPRPARLTMFLEGWSYFRNNIARDRARFQGNEPFFDLLDEHLRRPRRRTPGRTRSR